MSQIKFEKKREGSKWLHSTVETLLQTNLEAPYLSYIQNYTWVPSVKTSLQDGRLPRSSEQYNTVSWFKK